MKRFFVVLVAASFLTFLSIRLVEFPWVFSEEEHLVNIPTSLKKWLNKNILPNYFYDTNFIKNNFLIINVTRDQQLTTDGNSLSENGPGIPITDRSKLAKLFGLLYRDSSLYSFIICDVAFQLSSRDKKVDTELQTIIDKLEINDKIIFGRSYDEDKKAFDDSKIINNTKNIGSTSTQLVSEVFFKQRLLNNEETPSLPFLIYQKKHKLSYQTSWFPDLTVCRGSDRRFYFYNSFIPEMLFDRKDFDHFYGQSDGNSGLSYDSAMAICDLGKFLSDTALYPASLLYKTLNKKMIYIGSITGRHADIHQTIYGPLDGTIILLNTFTCIELGYNRFSLWEILITFAFFWGISYMIVAVKLEENQNHPATIRGYVWQMLLNRKYYILLILLTLINFFGFKHATNLILLVFVIELFHLIASHLDNYRLVKNTTKTKNEK
jgi:hypothetical protein